jgi:hypothetical protein
MMPTERRIGDREPVVFPPVELADDAAGDTNDLASLLRAALRPS